MNDRKQARAMDLPGYPCPPSVGDIPHHAASWGWVAASVIGQDDRGYLWAKATATPKITLAEENGGHRALLAWAEGGMAAWVDPRGYGSIARINGNIDEIHWVPISEVMKDLPAYANEK